MTKHNKNTKNKLKMILLSLFIIIFIFCIGYMSFYFYMVKKDKKHNSDILNEIKVDPTQLTEEKTEKMLKLEEL